LENISNLKRSLSEGVAVVSTNVACSPEEMSNFEAASPEFSDSSVPIY